MMPTEAQMIAAIYARKSSDNEAGVSRQVELARDFASRAPPGSGGDEQRGSKQRRCL